MDDLKADPIVMWQKKYFYFLALLFSLALPTIVYSLDCSLLAGYLYATLGDCVLINATWCVSSLYHMFGSRSWDEDILPTDNYFVSIIAIGEG